VEVDRLELQDRVVEEGLRDRLEEEEVEDRAVERDILWEEVEEDTLLLDRTVVEEVSEEVLGVTQFPMYAPSRGHLQEDNHLLPAHIYHIDHCQYSTHYHPEH
jgi:hypothetical protein